MSVAGRDANAGFTPDWVMSAITGEPSTATSQVVDLLDLDMNLTA